MSDPSRQAQRAYENQAWRRWEMDSVEPIENIEPEVDVPVQLSAQAQDNLARLAHLARDEGHAKGYAEGLELGRQQGLQEGRSQGLQSGHAEGFEAGMKEALAQGAANNDAEASRLAGLLDTCSQALHDIEAETGQALIRLAISISQQIIRSTLNAEPEKILDTVRDILQLEAGHDGLLRLRVHPDDLSLVQPYLADDPAARHWRIQADSTVERGGCIAETALGSIDATLQTRWQRVVASLGHNMPWTATP